MIQRLHGYSCNQIPIALVFSIQALTDKTKLLLPTIFRCIKKFACVRWLNSR